MNTRATHLVQRASLAWPDLPLFLDRKEYAGAGDHTQAGVLTGLTQHKDDEHDADEHLNDRENGNSHN